MTFPAMFNTIPAMSGPAIAKVGALEEEVRKLPQEDIETLHTIHAGVYTRTVMIPRGVVITGALIKIPTTLIVSGDATVFVGNEARRLRGYHVLPASGMRKQAFYAHKDTWLTMLFQTDLQHIDGIEQVFTDEYESLASRRHEGANKIIITEE